MFMEETPPHEGDVSELIPANQYIDKHNESVLEVMERADSAVKFKKVWQEVSVQQIFKSSYETQS